MPVKAKWNEEGQTISIYVTKDQAGQLQNEASTEQTTISDIVRRALRQYFSLSRNATDSSVNGDAA